MDCHVASQPLHLIGCRGCLGLVDMWSIKNVLPVIHREVIYDVDRYERNVELLGFPHECK